MGAGLAKHKLSILDRGQLPGVAQKLGSLSGAEIRTLWASFQRVQTGGFTLTRGQWEDTYQSLSPAPDVAAVFDVFDTTSSGIGACFVLWIASLAIFIQLLSQSKAWRCSLRSHCCRRWNVFKIGSNHIPRAW